jgi:hypothetical protein
MDCPAKQVVTLPDRCQAFLAVLILACGAAAAAPTSQPATQPLTQTFQNAAAGIRFCYPANWNGQKGQTALFDVIDPAKCDDGCSLSLDVPSLPRFFSGMITAGMIESGYVSDLRKNQIHDAKVDESIEIKMPGSSARRVKCSGHDHGKVVIDVAVLIVHADRVYIFSCDSDEAGYPAARAALDSAVASMQWIKK